MEAVDFESLDKALAIRRSITLSRTMDEGPVEVAAKFVAESADDDRPGIWIQPTTSILANSELYDRLAVDGTPLVGAFCDGDMRVVFDTSVEERNPHYWVNDRVVFEALRIRTPSELSTPEFRAAKRFRISDPRSGLTAKLFRRNGDATREVEASLWDVSTAGASFICPMDKRLQNTSPNELFVTMFFFRGQRITLPVRLARARPLSSRTLRMGMRFDYTNPALASMRGSLVLLCEALEAQER